MLSATQSPQGLPVGNNGIGHAPAGEQDPGFDARSAQTVHHGKRKADSQENERLSKRLSLLNIGEWERASSQAALLRSRLYLFC